MERPSYARVFSVDEVRLDFTMSDGETPPSLTVSAEGKVNSSGWTEAQLGPWIYIQPPADGILDIDFFARAPTGIVVFVLTSISAGAIMPVPGWVKGVRVHAATNEKVVMLDHAPVVSGLSMPWDRESVAGEGLPLPSPFPWFTPGVKAPAG